MLRTHAQFGDDQTASPIQGLIGSGPAMMGVYAMTRRVAASNASVLLIGETGTGKELVAKAIHQLSSRSSGPFVRVNCGALSESLLESELFGHVRGSFTGAVANRTGRFEAAHTGTIFLDEINSTTPQLQVKLLRVLQEREFERVGDTETISVDTRVIAASNRELLDEVAKDNFREDLYYRLAVIPIEMPSLRERPDYIPLLVNHFLQKNATQTGTVIKKIDPHAVEMLSLYRWPGNVRELENAVERACALCDDGQILPTDLPPQVVRHATAPTVEQTGTLPVGQTLDDYIRDHERHYIDETIKFNAGSREKAAKMLAISMATLYRKLEVKAKSPAGKK